MYFPKKLEEKGKENPQKKASDKPKSAAKMDQVCEVIR